MEALQKLKVVIDSMLVISQREVDAPIKAGNEWSLGHQQGVRKGYQSQIICLTMLQELVENELDMAATLPESSPKDSLSLIQTVEAALAMLTAKMRPKKEVIYPKIPRYGHCCQ
jgi:hypothetical protein